MKKRFLFLPFILLLSLAFVSCEKEKSIENGLTPVVIPPGGSALYTLTGGNSTCIGAVLSGTYKAGTALGATNTVELEVTVDSIGTYNVSTTTVNGISFSGTGTFSFTGEQTILLTGSGTPAGNGDFNFSTGAASCSFSVTVEPNGGSSGGSAVYDFTGGTSTCTGAIANGTYTAGVAVNAANTVILGVNVTTIGSYDIATATVNGIVYAATGTFDTTGIQNIILTATGTPATAGTFSYIPGSNGCTFNITVSPGSSTAVNFLKCKLDGVLVNFNASLVGYYVVPPSAGIPYSVSVQGKNSDVAGSIEELWVTVTNPTAPTTGDYSNRTFSMGMTDRASQVAFYPTGFPNLYWSSGLFNAGTLNVNISSVSTASAAGTFSGTIYENNGAGPATKQVTEGEFQITF